MVDGEQAKYINPRKLWTGAFVPNWLMERTEVSQGAKLCYARLAQFYNEEKGYAWPSQEALARCLGVGDRMVRNYIDELERHGLVDSLQVGVNESNHYQFLWHKWIGTSGPGRKSVSGPERKDTPGLDRKDSSDKENQVRESGIPVVSSSPPDSPEKQSTEAVQQLGPKDLMSLWNEIVKEPRVLKLTAARSQKAKLRLQTYKDQDFWRHVLGRLLETPFLRGDNDRGWRADFDWLVRNDENPARILEGKYDNRRVEPTMQDRAREIAANVRRLGGAGRSTEVKP